MTALRPRLVHGFLETCLLAMLDERADYGLSLSQRLAEAGLQDIPGGTLYPALVRLENQGLVSVDRRASESGPPRKYFALTPEGRRMLVARREEWRHFTSTLGGLIDPARQGLR